MMIKKGTSRHSTGLLCLLLGAVMSITALSFEKPTVISLSPAATELIYELELESHLMAVDQNSNFPEQAKQLPSIGDAFNPNLELLAHYHPDFVIHFSKSQALDAAQQSLNLTLIPMQPKNMEELFKQADELASKLGHSRTEQVNQWRQQWQTLNKRYQSNNISKKVFIYLGFNPIYTLGKNAFLSQSLHSCGVQGLFDTQTVASLMISGEQLLLNPPDKVLVGISTHESRQQRTQKIIDEFKTLGITLTEKQIVLVNQDILFRPSIRFLNYLPTLCQQLQTER